MKTDLMALVESKRAWLTALASAYIQTAQEFGANVSDFQVTCLQVLALVGLVVADAVRPMERKSKPPTIPPTVTPSGNVHVVASLLLCGLLVLPGCYRGQEEANHRGAVTPRVTANTEPAKPLSIDVKPPSTQAKATASIEAKGYSWLVLANDFAPVAVEHVDANRSVLFGVEAKKKYLLAVTALTDEGLSSAQSFYSAEPQPNPPGPEPDPDPPEPEPPSPPVFPDGRFKLAKAAYDWAEQAVSETHRGQGKQIAKEFSAVAAAIGAGAIKDFSAALDELRRRVAAYETNWKGWRDLYVAELGRLYDAGEVASVQDFAVALNEISTGLAAL